MQLVSMWWRELRSVGPAHVHHGWNGLEEDAQVFPDSPFPDVVGLQSNDRFEVGDQVTAADLPRSGHARLYIEAGVMVFLVEVDLGRERRPGPHQRHFSNQHIPKLRQLVQTSSPKERPEGGDSGIVLDLE